MVRFKKYAALSLIAMATLISCDNPVAEEGHPDFWAKSYFAETSPYPQGWINPAKKEYYYAESRGVSQTSDGGYVMSGFIRTFEEDDALILKVDSLGRVEKGFSIIGGTKLGEYRQTNFLNSALQTSDGGYIFSGFSSLRTWGNISYGSSNMLVLKADKDGKLLWSKGYGTHPYNKPASEIPNNEASGLYANEMIPAGDGTYMIAGNKLLKINANGNVLWGKNISLGGFNAIAQTADKGFIATCYTGDEKHNSVVRLSANGDVLWSKFYAVPGLKPTLSAVQIMTDAKGKETGFLLAGCLIYNENRSSDWLITAVDLYGSVLWEKTLGGGIYDPENLKFSDESAVSIIRTNDANYLIAGVSESFSGALNMTDVIIVKMTANGEILTQKKYGIQSPGVSKIIKTGKGFAFAGTCGNSRALLVSCDMNGHIPETVAQPGIEKDITFQVNYPTINEIDLSDSTILSPFTPVVSNTGSVLNTLKVDRERY